MPGFDRTRFVDISDQELNELICGLCLKVLDNPMSTSSCCQQIYCKDCIIYWLNQYETCPNDKLALNVEELKPPIIEVFNSLEALKIKCDFFDKGCKDVVNLKHLIEHIDNCPFNPIHINCKTCGLERGSDGQHDCIHNMYSEFYMEVGTDSFTEENKVSEDKSQIKTEIKQKIKTFVIVNEKKVEIIKCEMKEKLRDFAADMGQEAKRLFKTKTEMSEWIRSQFDRQWGKHWNCLISDHTDLATSFHYNPNYYIYFKVGTTYLTIWKST